MDVVSAIVLASGGALGICVFYLGFKVGRNTRYQDDNIPPPPDPIEPKKSSPWWQVISESILKRRESIQAKRQKLGIISENEEPDFTKGARDEQQTPN